MTWGRLNSNFKLAILENICFNLNETFKYTLPYMPSEYCGKQQSGFCIWPLGRLRTTETSFGAEITTVG